MFVHFTFFPKGRVFFLREDVLFIFWYKFIEKEYAKLEVYTTTAKMNIQIYIVLIWLIIHACCQLKVKRVRINNGRKGGYFNEALDYFMNPISPSSSFCSLRNAICSTGDCPNCRCKSHHTFISYKHGCVNETVSTNILKGIYFNAVLKTTANMLEKCNLFVQNFIQDILVSLNKPLSILILISLECFLKRYQ